MKESKSFNTMEDLTLLTERLSRQILKVRPFVLTTLFSFVDCPRVLH